MRLICPACGALASLEAWLADDDSRAVVALAARLPAALGPLVVRYLGLFRPAKRGLAWDRARALLDELARAIAAGEIVRDRRTYICTPAEWAAALEVVLDARPTLDLPLKTHGYLYEVIAAAARKRAATGEREADRASAPLHPSHVPAAAAAARSGPVPAAGAAARVIDRAAGHAGAAGLRAALGAPAGAVKPDENAV